MIQFWKFITEIGGVGVIAIFATIVALAVYRKNKRYSISIITVFIGQELTTFMLKNLIQRPRPLGGLIPEDGFSFPSGHTGRATAVLLLVALILGRIEDKRKRVYMSIALILTGLIGASRYFLGVHYISDIIGGLIVGLIWVFVGYLIIMRNKKTTQWWH